MRLAIVGTALITALMITGASAQATKMDTKGSKTFCSVNAGKANCNFDTAAACEKDIKDMGADGKGFQCSERTKLN